MYSRHSMNIFSVFLLMFLINYVCSSETRNIQRKSAIGILAHPVPKPFESLGKSSLSSSYVKWIESGGGVVIPIRYNIGKQELRVLMKKLNGLVIPGYHMPFWDEEFVERHWIPQNFDFDNETVISSDECVFSRYFNVVNYALSLALEMNDDGEYFPLWTTCLGFELLVIGIAKTYDILDKNIDAVYYSLPFLLNSDGSENSLMIKNIPKNLLTKARSKNLKFHNHLWGFRADVFSSNKNLKDFFHVLSTNDDRNGVNFVDSIEAKNYPFYGTQYHPEAGVFGSMYYPNIDFSSESVLLSVFLSMFFISETKKSDNRFGSLDELMGMSIENFFPTNMEKFCRMNQMELDGDTCESKYFFA